MLFFNLSLDSSLWKDKKSPLTFGCQLLPWPQTGSWQPLLPHPVILEINAKIKTFGRKLCNKLTLDNQFTALFWQQCHGECLHKVKSAIYWHREYRYKIFELYHHFLVMLIPLHKFLTCLWY